MKLKRNYAEGGLDITGLITKNSIEWGFGRGEVTVEREMRRERDEGPFSPKGAASPVSRRADLKLGKAILEEAKRLHSEAIKQGKALLRAHELTIKCLEDILGQDHTPEQYVWAFELLEKERLLFYIKGWDAKKLRLLLNNFLKKTNKELGKILDVSESAVTTQLGKLGWRRKNFTSFEATVALINSRIQEGKEHKKIVNELNKRGLWTARGNPWTEKSLEGYIRRGIVQRKRGIYKNNQQGKKSRKRARRRSK